MQKEGLKHMDDSSFEAMAAEIKGLMGIDKTRHFN